ncbi:MAG: tetratricopeptide repeat protein [Bacteroidales bacterium]|nr:tetratricopeptide repeat protein [Bacteroidales bacterium]
MADFDKLSFEEKMALLDNSLKRHPKDADLYFRRAKLYFEKENLKEALFNIEKAISLDKTQVDYFLLEADIYFAYGKTQLSFDALNNVKKLDKKNLKAYLKSAELAIDLRDYNRARENLDEVMKIDKINAEAYFMRGWIYKEIGDTVNAVKDYRKAIEYKSDYEHAFEELANLFAVRGDALAIEYYKSVININPKNVSAMYNLGLFYQEHGSIQQALDLYKRVLDIKPDYANAIYAVGWINHVYKDDLETALDCYNKTIKADSTYFEAYSGRAAVYKRQGKSALANENYAIADSLRKIYGN